MKGILKEKNEIEKLQNEFKILTRRQSKDTPTKEEELQLKESEL